MSTIKICSLSLVLFFLIILPVVAKASGIFSPTISKRQVVDKGDLKWYSVIKSLNIQKDQTELKRRWNDYWEKLDQYSQSHPGINQQVLKYMKYCNAVVGMTEDQVLFIAEPSKIDSISLSDERILFYEATLDKKETWVKTWITIRNGKVINIEEQISTYGW